MLAWMVYAVLVTVLLAAAARALEEGARALGRPTRFVWVGALVGAVALTALAPVRAPDRIAIPVTLEAGEALVAESSGAGDVAAAVRVATDRARRVVTWPVRAAATIEPAAPVGRALAGAWIALAVAVTLLGLVTHRRYRAARRRWPLRELCGVPVRVSPTVGPAVLGLLRPEIVVPAWLAARPERERRVVILHEREHVRAGDAWTLAAGWLGVALLPWNPVAWWLWKRLRLAVELDCDARVLRHDVARRAYGTMLIDMAGRGSGLSLGVPALSGSPTTLERRLIAMTAPFKHGNPVRATAFAALGALTVLAACESQLPTAAEVQELDAATAEAAARKLELTAATGEPVTYFVNGREVSAEEARSLAPEDLAAVEIARGGSAEGATIHLRVVAEEGRDPADPARQDVKVHTIAPVSDAFDGLLIVDGQEAPASRIGEIEPSEIERVEVIKGPAAAALSDDPRAARGIIRVTTKAGAGGA